jgi:hypothetical protein
MSSLSKRLSNRPLARPIGVFALATAVVGCAMASLPPAGAGSAAGPDPRLVVRATASAADQVKRCYRSPRLGRDARQIATRMRVRFAPTGELVGMPVLLSQAGVTPSNRPFAAAMAAAAASAIVDCSPLRLPPELHGGGWDEFDLTFSPANFG